MHDFFHYMAPFMWAGVGMVWVWLAHKQKMARIAAENGFDPGVTRQIEALNLAHERELGELRERVRVLERIATDAERSRGPQALAAQIDALRD